LLGLPVVKRSRVSGAVEAAEETSRATTAARDRENERSGDKLRRSAEKAALEAQECAERAAVERKRMQGQRLSAQRWIQ
jgi:Mrp family chromosome partitioning ATPase